MVEVANKNQLVEGTKTSNNNKANVKVKVVDVNEPPMLLEDSKNFKGFCLFNEYLILL